MTLLDITLTVPTADGSLLPATGAVRFTPTKRREFNGTTVLPKPFMVQLTLGAAQVELAPNDEAWAWRIDEHTAGSPARTIFANIPDTTTVNYTDLVSIDPATLTPTADLTPAWVEKFDALVEQVNNTHALMEDPLNQGFYLVPQYSPITADPDNSGFYLTGA